MENVIKVIEKFCTFPEIEKTKLFMRMLFCFITGNEDMHIKNFSVITQNNIIQLAPAYDFLNTTLALVRVKEELALALRGRKNNLTRNDFVKYFAKERMGLNDLIITKTLNKIEMAIVSWPALIQDSFLPEDYKKRYLEIVNERWERLNHR
jgi:serine/threonine-protein kinase HipA